jgi:hypothetical protein
MENKSYNLRIPFAHCLRFRLRPTVYSRNCERMYVRNYILTITRMENTETLFIL